MRKALTGVLTVVLVGVLTAVVFAAVDSSNDDPAPAATTTTTTTPETAAAGARTVDALLEGVSSGTGVPVGLFAPDAVLDATVPGWRFPVRGADAVARQYSGWFTQPAVFEELERLAVHGGEVVTYLITWVEGGIPHAAHHCHVLRFAPNGCIAADRFFCGGRWPAGLLAEMEAASDAG